MTKKKKPALKMQHIYRFTAPKHEMEPFGLSEPEMTEKAMARIVLFAKAVKDLLPKLFGFDYEITVGMKLVDVKKGKFYGTYIVLGRKFVSEKPFDEIYKMMIDKFQEVHEELDKNLKIHILSENGISKPLSKIE